MNDIPHVNVLIATPGNLLHAGYVKSLLALCDTLVRNNITWAFSNEYSSHVAHAREITLSGTRKNNYFDSRPLQGMVTYDKIMWIDSDIVFEVQDFMKLYNSDKDIISGAYLLADGTSAAYKSIKLGGLSITEILEMTDIEELEYVGFGFLCVKQGVFEAITRPWFKQVTETVEVDGETLADFPLMGEDFSWCARARKAGFKIHLDPEVKVTHHKSVKLTWEGMMPYV